MDEPMYTEAQLQEAIQKAVAQSGTGLKTEVDKLTSELSEARAVAEKNSSDFSAKEIEANEKRKQAIAQLEVEYKAYKRNYLIDSKLDKFIQKVLSI